MVLFCFIYVCVFIYINAFLIAQLVKNPPAIQETLVNSWVRMICCRRDRLPTPVFLGFPCGSAGKESTCDAGDLGSIPGLGKFPGEGKGYPLQDSGLENSMGYSPWGHKELDMTEWLSISLHFHIYSLNMHTCVWKEKKSRNIYSSIQERHIVCLPWARYCGGGSNRTRVPVLGSLDNADSRIQGVTCVPAGYWQCALYEVMWRSFIHHLHAFLYLPIYLFFALVWHGRTYIKITIKP